jgi:hypothetical protein
VIYMKFELTLRDELHQRLSNKKKETGHSMATIIRIALERYLDGGATIVKKTRKVTQPMSKLDKYIQQFKNANPDAEVYREGDSIVIKRSSITIKNPLPESLR